MPAKPKSIDEYLKRLSEEQRAALERLRRTIRTAAPKAEEVISYGIPAFRLDGRFLVAFGVGKRHCAFYPGALPVRVFEKELRAYDVSKGTIRFRPGKPLPAALVRKLVKARAAERSAKASVPRRR